MINPLFSFFVSPGLTLTADNRDRRTVLIEWRGNNGVRRPAALAAQMQMIAPQHKRKRLLVSGPPLGSLKSCKIIASINS